MDLGYQVTVYHDKLYSVNTLFSGLDCKPFPSKSKLHEVLDEATLSVFNQNCHLSLYCSPFSGTHIFIRTNHKKVKYSEQVSAM